MAWSDIKISIIADYLMYFFVFVKLYPIKKEALHVVLV